MTMAKADARTALGPAQCLEISGADAEAFAQAQFSGDLRALRPMHWQWNAWLDHRGGVRALMHLARLDGDAGNTRLFALLRGGEASLIASELRRYVLRSLVRIELVPGRFLSLGPPLPLHELRTEADAIGFGYGERSVWIETTPRAIDAARERELRLAGIRKGWPLLPRGCEGEFLPPALGLEHLGAVSFEKGCYPGQEVAARLHYRGGHKRRLAHVLARSAWHPGDPLVPDDARDRVLDAVEAPQGWHVLAVINEASVGESKDLQDKLQVIQRFGV